MTVYVRKTILLPIVSFLAADGSGRQPDAVSMVLSYADLNGVTQTTTLALSFVSSVVLDGLTYTNVWTGSWDSSAAGTCTVTWLAYAQGTAQAAAQGQFEINANTLNTV